MNITKTFRKGQWVTYRPWNGCAPHRVKAIVSRVHRDGDCTVQAFFALDDAGKSVGGFIGYRYRVPFTRLSAA